MGGYWDHGAHECIILLKVFGKAILEPIDCLLSINEIGHWCFESVKHAPGILENLLFGLLAGNLQHARFHLINMNAKDTSRVKSRSRVGIRKDLTAQPAALRASAAARTVEPTS